VSYASLPFVGSIDWRGLAFIEITGLTPSQRYVVTLAGPDNVTLLTYPDDFSFTTTSCSSHPEGELPAACAITPTTSNIHLAIDATFDSSQIELDVRPVPANAAPNPSDPVAFALAELPGALSAVPFEPSYYEITGVAPGTQYVLSATSTDELITLAVRNDPNAIEPWDERNARSPQVVATPTSTSLYVQLKATTFGSAVELSIEPPTFVSEGSVAAPVTVTAAMMPLVGEVGAVRAPYAVGPGGWPMIHAEPSRYAITGLSPGTHRVRMTAQPGIAIGTFGDDGAFAHPLCYGIVQEVEEAAECTATITGSTLYFGAFNSGGGGSEVRFELDDAPFLSEGSVLAPIVHSIDEGSLSGTVAASEQSYYRFQDVRPRTPYRFALGAPMDTPAAVMIYEPGHLDEPLCQISPSEGEGSECVVMTNGTQLDVAVASNPSRPEPSNVGTAFEVTFESLAEQEEATETEPLTFSCEAGDYTAEVGTSGESYYEVDGLTPNASYMVEIYDASGSYALAVETTNAWSGATVCTEGAMGVPGRCRRGPGADGTLHIRVQGLARMTFRVRVTAAMSGSEASASAPFLIDHNASSYVGRVASAAPSYYKLAGLTRSKLYAMELASEQETVEIEVFRAGFSGPGPQLNKAAVSPGSPDGVVFAAPASDVFFTVSLPPEADGATTFSLKVTPY
jgi:hypothetical protein